MNREFKFRVWDSLTKRMYCWKIDVSNYLKQDGTCYDTFTVLQYTGLKDKNGVEIYEGDIIYKNYTQGYKNKPFVVEWREQSLGYNIKQNNNAHNYEVIGNIYENPELLSK